MAASSSAGGYDAFADPDVPCGSITLDHKFRPACTFKCCVRPVEDLTADSKNASPARNTPLSQATTDNSNPATQSPAPAAQAQESETEIDIPDHASSVATTPASRGTEAHPEVVDPLRNYNPKRRRLNEALDGAGQ